MGGWYAVGPETRYRDFLSAVLKLAPEALGAPGFWTLPPGDVRPGTHIPALGVDTPSGRRGTFKAHWGLCPHWAAPDAELHTTKSGRRALKWRGRAMGHFKSRLDTLQNGKGWRDLVSRRRAVVLCDSFLEWSDPELLSPGAEKKRARFRLTGGRIMVFPAIWDSIPDGPGHFHSISFITTEPNGLLQGLPHDRMPAILKESEIAQWLDPKKKDEVLGLLGTTSEDQMIMEYE